MSDPSNDPVIATLSASPPRRWTGTVMLTFLGGLMVYLALSVPFSVSQIGLFLCGLIALFAATRMHTSTAQEIELTQTELRIKGGIVLAQVANIARVERGAFAFKPSNGFLVSLKEAGPRGWALGLYWRFGKRLGVGGVTGAPQTKGMAEALAILIAARNQT
jgi:hypothetical protein